VILLFRAINNEAVISGIFTAAGYTYGPLLGLFAFGIYTKFDIRDKIVPLVCLLAPILSFFISYYSPKLFAGYQIGFELLLINGLLTFVGLWFIRKKSMNVIA
jgi:hypothetical protein